MAVDCSVQLLPALAPIYVSITRFRSRWSRSICEWKRAVRACRQWRRRWWHGKINKIKLSRSNCRRAMHITLAFIWRVVDSLQWQNDPPLFRRGVERFYRGIVKIHSWTWLSNRVIKNGFKVVSFILFHKTQTQNNRRRRNVRTEKHHRTPISVRSRIAFSFIILAKYSNCQCVVFSLCFIWNLYCAKKSNSQNVVFRCCGGGDGIKSLFGNHNVTAVRQNRNIFVTSWKKNNLSRHCNDLH